jgi:NitT/TauT family transport system ATP-binding protein
VSLAGSFCRVPPIAHRLWHGDAALAAARIALIAARSRWLYTVGYVPKAVEIRGVRRHFRIPRGLLGAEETVHALDGIDLSIDEGSFVALIGPSGCGKSTLLRIVAGLDVPDEGTVLVPALARGEVAYVFQDAHLLPWRSVAANVALPLELRGVPREEREAKVKEALEEVELSDAASRYPAELSGGMRMRASIARALVTRPKLLLMDEPFAALDELTRQRLDERLLAVWREHRFTVLFVTHAIFEATFLAERAVVLSGRPARIVHDGAVDLPPLRTAATRGEPAFAREAGTLLASLEQGAG